MYIVLVSFVIIVFFTDTNFCRLRKDFKQLLEETGYVTPGKQLDEVNFIIDLVNLSRSPYYFKTHDHDQHDHHQHHDHHDDHRHHHHHHHYHNHHRHHHDDNLQVRVLFMGRECFESLPENELHQIYQLHQQVLNDHDHDHDNDDDEEVGTPDLPTSDNEFLFNANLNG